jgi:V8-like Glu-specific endopeptidase
MIQGRRLLTNAHCVEHHTQVSVGIPPMRFNSMHAVSDDDVALRDLSNFF